jgi:hypothetical protein
VTAALGGALLLSALVAQARGSSDFDASPPAPTPLGTTPDAGAPTQGLPGADAPLPSASPAGTGLPTASGISAQPLPAAPEPKPADINKPVGLWQPPHYDEGFVLVATPESAPLPYLLRLNHVSQFKYTNSMAVHSTYVTHLGEVKDVNKRNDFQLTRDVFYFSGYVFDKRLD